MAKTACEEAAELLSDDYGIVGLSARKRLSTHPDARNKLSKRIRAEGRELKRLRKLVVWLNADQYQYKFAERVPVFMAVRHEAAKIQKARTKK